MDILFVDNGRQDEIETFYESCQRHRNYYKGYSCSRHPLAYFHEPQYLWQCPSEMTPTYLGFPDTNVKYKQPVGLPTDRGRTSGIPALPDRTLAARYNKAACKAFIR
ncbi:uncharacterized protein [Battus philenor]|uniref:uncharacterized protein n=1 Tax=Battus philenor TaxID=42288 RepID=UPI0035D007F4